MFLLAVDDPEVGLRVNLGAFAEPDIARNAYDWLMNRERWAYRGMRVVIEEIPVYQTVSGWVQWRGRTPEPEIVFDSAEVGAAARETATVQATTEAVTEWLRGGSVEDMMTGPFPFDPDPDPVADEVDGQWQEHGEFCPVCQDAECPDPVPADG